MKLGMVEPTRVAAILLAAISILALSACAPSAAPTATVAPTKPAAVPTSAAKPPAASPAATKPAGSPAASPAATSAAKPAASGDWDKIVAAARQEGTVVVAGGPGETYRTAAMAFEKSYPGIHVEFSGMRGTDFTPRLLAERDGGKYLWDIWIGGWDTALDLKPKGAIAPLRPALVLPEVLDNSKWLGGFDGNWVDNDKQYMFQFASRIQVLAYVNRDGVPESELSTADQLLDAKWQGKISSLDPRTGGNVNSYVAYLLTVKGEDWVRKLLGQGLVLATDGRQQAESLVRGTYPIALAPTSDVEPLRKEGLGKNVKPLDVKSEAGARLVSGFGNLMLIDKAPHLNAAQVFANWQLTLDGQKAYVDATDLNVAFLPYPGPAEFAPDPKATYRIREREAFLKQLDTARARDIAKEVIK